MAQRLTERRLTERRRQISALRKQISSLRDEVESVAAKGRGREPSAADVEESTHLGFDPASDIFPAKRLQVSNLPICSSRETA